MSTEDSERRYAQIEGERGYYKRLASKRALHIDDQNARIAHLEADCAAHKAAEETQIALRQKADERDQALAAHVERLRSALNYSSEYLYASHLNTIGHGSKAHMEMVSALEGTQHCRGEP